MMHAAPVTSPQPPEQSFYDSMASKGLAPPDLPIADGERHRYHVDGDKPGSKNGWYVLYINGVPAGSFGTWKDGPPWHKWCAKEHLSDAEREEYRQRMERIEAERAKEQAERYAEARNKAQDIWRKASPNPQHPYLQDKGIRAYRIREHQGFLIVPAHDTDGVIHSVQFISANGEKRFLPGGAITGHYCSIGTPKQRIYLCEGYATGASIHEATQCGVAVAFHGGNLLPVAKAIRHKYPDHDLVIAGDNDQWTEGNPGKTKAIKAAQAVNATKLVIPSFKDTKPKPTDFNDLHRLEGMEAVRLQLKDARKPKSNTDSTLGFVRLGDLLTQPEEQIEFLLEDILPTAGTSMLVARPKAGKSTLARAFSLAVARGESFLGRQTIKGPVLYLGMEEKRSQVKAHFSKMGAQKDDEVYIYCKSAPQEALVWLTAATKKYRPILIIVDTVQRLTRVKDGNDYAGVSNSLEPIVDLARESGAHLMLIHHAGRADREGVDAPMGSTAFAGVVDTILTLKRRNEGMRTLSSVQRYGEDLEEIVVAMDDCGRITAAGSRQERDEQDTADTIAAFLKSSPGADQQQIREGVEGKTVTIVRVLQRMLEAGSVSRDGEGKRGNPYSYTLTKDSGFLVPNYIREPENQKPENGEKPHFPSPDSGSRNFTDSSKTPDQREPETGTQDPPGETAPKARESGELRATVQGKI